MKFYVVESLSVGARCSFCSMTPIWRLEVLGASLIFGKLFTPTLNLTLNIINLVQSPIFSCLQVAFRVILPLPKKCYSKTVLSYQILNFTFSIFFIFTDLLPSSYSSLYLRSKYFALHIILTNFRTVFSRQHEKTNFCSVY